MATPDQQPVFPAKPSSAGDDGAKLVGTWALICLRRSNGEVLAAPDACGLIIYDASGNMAAQIVLSDDAARSGRTIGYSAYFGGYSVDEAASTVTHHRVANTDPSRPRDVVRRFSLDLEGRLTLQPLEHVGDELMFERAG